MKLSFDWLSDYVDLSGLTPEEVAEKLTMGAFEVEEIKYVGPELKGDIVVGEILDIRPHPDAQKIRLTTTRVSPDEEPRQIVCGAWNIEVGMHIPVAMPGSVVIDRKEGKPLEIKESKVRGELSRGMLCSAPELGIAGNGEGILVLDKSTRVGSDAKEILGLKQDAILYVGPRSNRGDALSVIGMAREVAALFGRPLKEPQWKLPTETAGAAPFGVAVESTEDCPFFTIRLLSDLKVGPAPDWMVRRLEAVGTRSINNIVDVTNYVMQELGQPLHAYDVAQLKGNHLEARRARSGEKLTTIDDRERQLNEEALIIADKSGPVGIAGVMGGKGSEISDATTTVALEAAAFNSARVRRSSRLLGLASDSSLRFERGVDIASVTKASDRAAYLLVEHCGAKLHTLSTAGDDAAKQISVPLRLEQITRLADIVVDVDTVEKLLTPLGFHITPIDGGSETGSARVEVEVPSFRSKDVTREVDLIEEVVRLYGYDKVPTLMPLRTIAPPLPDLLPQRIKESLSAGGLNEIWASSLVATHDLTGRSHLSAEHSRETTAIRVLNPLSEDHQAMRLSLLPGLLKAVAYNQDRGQQDVWLFEVGLTYERDPKVATDKYTSGAMHNLHVAGIISGSRQLGVWSQGIAGKVTMASKDAEAAEFYALKGVLTNLFTRLAIEDSKIQYQAQDNTPGWFHPSRSAKIAFSPEGKDKREQPLDLGWIGEIHPAVAETYGLKRSACVFELSVENLRKLMKPHGFHELYNTPQVVRDLTVDVDRTTPQAPVLKCINQFGGRLLQEVELVSVFDLSDEKRSLSYRLTFQHSEQTLTADKVEEIINKIRKQLAQQLSATFRV